MKVKAIKTDAFIPPKDDMYSKFEKAFKDVDVPEESVIVITSKVIAIHQGRSVHQDAIPKDELVELEADEYIPRDVVPGEYVILTIKDNIFIPTAGIDKSNSNGYYILWPEKKYEEAKNLWKFFRELKNLNDLGIIISDSHTTPMRTGTSGIALAYHGFKPIDDIRGKEDIFGEKLKITIRNMIDPLAAAAVLMMGEGNEQTPVALIENCDFLKFADYGEEKDILIDRHKDIYVGTLDTGQWKKGKGGLTNFSEVRAAS